ncbi:zinc finger, PMZ-type containing protein [Tanacetum coccineum]
MRFKRQLSVRKPVTIRSRKQGKGCSKDVGGSTNNGEDCSKDVGGSGNDGHGCSNVGGSATPGVSSSMDVGESATPGSSKWNRKKIAEAKKIIPSVVRSISDWLPNAEHRRCTRHVLEVKCPAFENGICESYHIAIIVQRSKPIITMLEDIRIYLMQRLVVMSKNAMDLEDIVTQSNWVVIPSGFQELEVRKGNESYGVNLVRKQCQCRFWEISGIPCVHAIAGYMHLNRDPDVGVSGWYSQEKWFSAYQFSIKPVCGTSMWKKTGNQPPLPPIIRTMLGRPIKNKIRAPSVDPNE